MRINVKSRLKKWGIALLPLLLVTAVALGYVVVISQPTVAATGLTAEDVHIESSGGRVSSLHISPNLTVNWEGFDSRVQQIQVSFTVTGPNNQGTTGEQNFTVEAPSQSGSKELNASRVPLIQGGPLEARSFHVPKDDSTDESKVTVGVNLKMIDESGDVVYNESNLVTTTYTVTVTNKGANVGVSGQLNTGGKPACVGSESIVEEIASLFRC